MILVVKKRATLLSGLKLGEKRIFGMKRWSVARCSLICSNATKSSGYYYAAALFFSV